MPRSRILSLALAILLPLSACDQGPGMPDEPTIVLDKTTLDFGRDRGLGVYIGTAPNESFAIQNRGLQTLTLSGIDQEGDSAFTFEGPLETTLEANDRTFVRVVFRPTEPRVFEGKLTIRSNAAKVPSQVIELTGTGVSPP